jgi:hypothetical protein
LPPEITQSLTVEGVTKSRTMVQASFRHPCSPGHSLSALPGMMAKNQKNLHLFVGTEWEGKIEVTSCLADEEGSWLREWFAGAEGLEASALQDVGLVSVFPHRFGLKMTGLALMAFAEAGIPLFGFCSSLSALTFITPCPYVEKADATLRACFELPVGP